MKVHLLSPDDPAWGSFLAGVPHDFYHLPGYVRLAAKDEGGEPRAICVEDGGRQMLLPVVVRRVNDAGVDGTSPYGYPGPLALGSSDPAFLRDAFGTAKEHLKREGWVSLFVRLHPLLNPVIPDGMGTVVQHGETVAIDLTLPTEQLWSQTHSGHRNEINRSIRAGHRAYFDEGWEHLGTFVRLYRATMERVEAAEYYFFAEDYFRDLRAALGDRLRLCVVDIAGAIAAAGLFVETRGIVQYHLSGTDAAYARERPTKLMLHFVRGWAKERGDARMHLGGGVGAAQDSLFKFKAGFSKLRQPFRTLRLVVDEEKYAELVRARDASWDAGNTSGFFPLYRQRAS